MMLFTEAMKVLRVSAATAAGQNTITTDVVDMAQDGGFEEVVFLVGTQTLGDTSEMSAIVQAAPAADFTDGADVKDSALTIEGTDDNKAVVISVLHPPARYVALSITIGTANSAFGEIYAILRRGRNSPVAYAADATTITHNVVNGVLAESLTTQGS